jgi:hypothetical protein
MRIRHFLLLGVTALLSFPAAAQVSFVFPADMDPYTKGLAYEEAAEIEAEFKARLNGAAPSLKNNDPLPIHEVVQVDGGVEFHLSFEDITNDTNDGFDDDRNGESRRAHVIAAVETLSRNLDGSTQVRPVEVFFPEMQTNQFLVGSASPFSCDDAGSPSNQRGWHAIFTGERLSSDQFNYDILIDVDDRGWPGDCSVFGCTELEPDETNVYDLESLILSAMVNGLGVSGSPLVRSGRDQDGPWRTDTCRPWFEESEPAVFSQYQAALVDESGDPIYSSTGEYVGDDTDPTNPDAKWFVETSQGRLPVTPSGGIGGFWHQDRVQAVGPRLRGPTVEPGVVLPRDLDPEDRVVLRDVLGYIVRGNTTVECTIHCDNFEAIENVGVLNGAFYDPMAPGDGYNIIVTDSETLVVFWYGSDAAGDRLWLISNTLDIGELGWEEEVTLQMREGAPATFQSPSQDLPDWGELRISFSDCFNATATLDGVDGAKTQEITRIARLGGIACDPS